MDINKRLKNDIKENKNYENYNKFDTLNYSYNNKNDSFKENSYYNYNNNNDDNMIDNYNYNSNKNTNKQSNFNNLSNTYFTTNKFNSFNLNENDNFIKDLNIENEKEKDDNQPKINLLNNLNYKYNNNPNNPRDKIKKYSFQKNTNNENQRISFSNVKDDEIEFNFYKSDSLFENKNEKEDVFLSSNRSYRDTNINTNNKKYLQNDKYKNQMFLNNNKINNLSLTQHKDNELSKEKDINYNEHINKLEEIGGCLIYKRNNFISKNKVRTSVFYANEFNPSDYGFNEYIIIFDKKRNKLIFNKKEDSLNKTDVYIASLTSVKIPQYTKNLLFVKQVYKKFKNNFSTYDEMDDYIQNNSHFLVNLFYNNNTDKNIKFDNRLYSKAFRRDLLENDNYILYLNLISENARIEIMFRRYEDYKLWKKGLDELVSLRTL
jgi:hypothetical protein